MKLGFLDFETLKYVIYNDNLEIVAEFDTYQDAIEWLKTNELKKAS